MDAFEEALLINPDDATAWNNKGNALGVLGRYQESLDAYGKALSLNPDDANAWNNKGTTLGNLGRYKEAMDCFDRSLGINPHNKDILTFRELVRSALEKSKPVPGHSVPPGYEKSPCRKGEYGDLFYRAAQGKWFWGKRLIALC